MSNAAAAAAGAGAGAGAGFQFYVPVQDIDSYFTERFDDLHVHIMSETHSMFASLLADHNTKMRLSLNIVKPGFNTVIEITGRRKGTSNMFPLVAAIIRSGIKDGIVIHELYSVSTSNEYKNLLDIENSSASALPNRPSIAKELLKYVLAFHTNLKLTDEGDIARGPETRPFLYWLGVRTDVDPQGLSRLMKLYQDAGFFFPNLICMLRKARLNRSYVNNRQNTPLGGGVIPFKFIAGYWSPSIKQYTDGYDQAFFNADNASESIIGREKNYGLLSQRVEHAGFLNIDDRNMAVREPVNESFVARSARLYEIVSYDGGQGGSYFLKDQVQYRHSAPCGTFFVDPTKDSFRRFQFHTHPLICHYEANIARGFPSQPDIQCLFRRAADMNVGGLMVFSREGSWLIRMNPYLMFLKDKYPDRYETYRAKTEAYLEKLTIDETEIGFYNSTRNYSLAEITAGTNTIIHIATMITPSDDDLVKAEAFLGLLNSRYLLPFRVDGMEMAPFSIQFIRRNEPAGEYQFLYIKKK